MRFRTAVAAASCLLGATLVLAACQAPKSLDSVWPRADSERTIAKPPELARWPLTGLDAPSADAARVRIVSVKVENAPAARPQSGLDQADVVFETLTEGGITRFNALYQSKAPRKVGPVRSARASDLYIVPQYHALFAHVGGDSNLMRTLENHTRYQDMDQFFNPDPYTRSHDRAAPHNVYVDIARLRAVAVSARKYPALLETKGLAFSRAAMDTSTTISSVTVPFAADNKVTWRYDPKTKTYLRYINGKAHVDAVSHRQYRTKNVVVAWTTVKSRPHRDVAGSRTVEIVLAGSGRVSVFRDGVRYDGSWQATLDAPPVFRASDGRSIRLAPGNTWFEVIANNQNITMK